MNRLLFLVRRLVLAFVLIMGVLTFLFFFFRMMPGDYATLLISSGADAEAAEEIRESWGLNDPLYVQYYEYMTNMLSGDPGVSRRTGESVWGMVIVALSNTLILALPAIVLAIILGTIFGAILGSSPGSKLEKYGIIPPTFAGTTPDFFIGILLLVVFSAWLGWFPSQDIASLETHRATDAFWEIYLTRDFLMHYTLPFMTILLKYLYLPTLIMRGSVVEVQGQEFMSYQRLVGIRARKRLKHIMKHASLPVITIVPAVTATAIGGQVLVEIVFNWPGIGRLLFESVLERDTPVIQFLFLIIAAWIILGNLIVDILYTVIDPRITYGGEE